MECESSQPSAALKNDRGRLVTRAIFAMKSGEGTVTPRSHLEVELGSDPMRLESSSWLRPAESRASRILLLNVIGADHTRAGSQEPAPIVTLLGAVSRIQAWKKRHWPVF
jgi:hypothetical protein